MVERNIVGSGILSRLPRIGSYPEKLLNREAIERSGKFALERCWVNKRLRRRAAFELIFQRDCRLLSLHSPRIKMGLGDNTMPRRPIVAATMIVAASLIGITQARLPRPIRDYRDRGGAEIAAVDALGAGVPTH